jgi:hypothetical protein
MAWDNRDWSTPLRHHAVRKTAPRPVVSTPMRLLFLFPPGTHIIVGDGERQAVVELMSKESLLGGFGKSEPVAGWLDTCHSPRDMQRAHGSRRKPNTLGIW